MHPMSLPTLPTRHMTRVLHCSRRALFDDLTTREDRGSALSDQANLLHESIFHSFSADVLYRPTHMIDGHPDELRETVDRRTSQRRGTAQGGLVATFFHYLESLRFVGVPLPERSLAS